jgi:hypothetical protein
MELVAFLQKLRRHRWKTKGPWTPFFLSWKKSGNNPWLIKGVMISG